MDRGWLFESPLHVTDVATCADGRLILIEIKDGGCARIPIPVDTLEYCRATAKNAAKRSGLSTSIRDSQMIALSSSTADGACVK